MAIRSTPQAAKMPLNIVGGSTFGKYDYISTEKTYNCYQSDNFLVSFAGWKKQYDILPEGQGRGLFHSIRGNFLIAVVNASVYRIDPNLGLTLLGHLDSFQGEVYMDENLNNQICIVDGLKAYIYYHLGAPSVVPVTLSAGPAIPSYVSFHNSFFNFGNGDMTSNGSAWYSYSPGMSNTTLTHQATMSLQTKPDFAIAVKRIPSQGNNVLVFGTSVCEIWTQTLVTTGGVVLNYRRNETINIDYGCLNVTTIASSDEYIAWLGVNESNAPVIMVYSRQGAQRISTDGIDNVLDNLLYPEQSTAMMYRLDGHLFYQITFYNPKDNLTLAYDFNTQSFSHLSDSHLNYHPAIDTIYFNQKSYFLSLRNAALYEFSTDLYTYDENAGDGNVPELINEMQRIRICKNLRSDDSARFIANQVVITIEQGNDSGYVALNHAANDNLITEFTLQNIITEDGQDIMAEDSLNSVQQLIYRPRVDLSVSYDGGVTFGSYVAREMNPLGKRKNQMTWEKLGAANDLTLKFRFWGNGRWIVNNGYVEVY